jgi:hypothetical protein
MLAGNPGDLLILLVGPLEESRSRACQPLGCLHGNNRMTAPMHNDAFRRMRLLRIFDSLIVHATSLVAERYGDAEAGRFVVDARGRFEQLLHGSAYLDGRQPPTRLSVLSTCSRAIYWAVQARGGALADARQLCSDIFDAKLRRMSC